MNPLNPAKRLLESVKKAFPDFDHDYPPVTSTVERYENDVDKIVATFDSLVRRNLIVFNERPGDQVLIAKKDGRRSKDYPDSLMGWRYMGALDEYGKPVGAPHWVELHVRSDLITGLASVKIARFPLPRDLNVGDWVCRIPDGKPKREIHCVLTAAEARKWYGV